MITLDMINKTSELRITEKMFTLENNILTLEIDPGNYDLTDKVITASFNLTGVETAPLTVSAEGMILLPIYSNLVAHGINYIQLNFRWDVDKLEQSGKMMWRIDSSIPTTEVAQEDIDIINFLVNEVNLAVDEADRVVDETGDIKIALDGSISGANLIKGTLDASILSANTINNTLSDEATGTIKQASDMNVILEGNIDDAELLQGEIEDAIVNNQIVTLPVFNAHKIDYATLEGVNDGVLTHNKTSFIEVYPNLFNYKKIVTGFTPELVFGVSSYDNLIVSATSITAEVIEVEDVLSFVTNIPNASVTYYGSNGLRSGGVNATLTGAYYSFTVPAGTKYIRVRFQIDYLANVNTFMIIKGSVYPSEYIPWGGLLKDDIKVDYAQIKNAPSTNSPVFKKNTVCLFGDSITALNTMNTDITKRTYVEGYFTWANIFLRQRFKLLNNAGIGGNTTAQMLVRIQSDVLDYNPSYCFVVAGINDIIQSVSASAIIANLTSIYNQLLSKGIIVIASKILPSTMITTGAFLSNVNLVNKFIQDFAFANDNFILINMGKYFSDVETGNPPTAMSTDGSHPVKLGGYYLGKAIFEELQYIIPLRNDFGLSNSKKDTINPNPMMTGDVSGLATSYSLVSNAYTVASKIPRTDIIGEIQRLTVSDTNASPTFFGLTSSMGVGVIAPTEQYYAQCEVTLSDILKYKVVKLYLDVYDVSNAVVASTSALYSQDTLEVTMPNWSGILKTMPITVPSTGVKLISKIEYNIKGILDVGRYEVKKV